jgi:hypothetical protein
MQPYFVVRDRSKILSKMQRDAAAAEVDKLYIDGRLPSSADKQLIVAQMLTRICDHVTVSRRTAVCALSAAPAAAAGPDATGAAPAVLPPEPRLEALIRPEVLSAFDRAQFERDGYWLWAGALTDEGRERMTGSLQQLQAMQDYMIMETDWAAGIDWARRNLEPPPPKRITREWRETRVCGGSEQLSYYPAQGDQPEVGKGFLNMPTRAYMSEVGLFGSGADALATDGSWESQGHMPEFAPLCHSPFLLDLATAHPQMMEIFTKLFHGRESFRLDHTVVLNRKGGEGTGRHWHAHRYADGRYEEHAEDSAGDAPNPEFLRQQCIRTLCYPEGAAAVDAGGQGGELGLVPGAHLFRVPFEASFSHADDAAMERWCVAAHIFTQSPKPLPIYSSVPLLRAQITLMTTTDTVARLAL